MMNMKKISLYATLLASVAMTACTDYVGQIDEAHDDYVNSNVPKMEIYTSGCGCNVNYGNLLDIGGQFYYNTESNYPHITFALVGCNSPSSIDEVRRESGAYDNLFIETYDVYQSEGVYWADFALNGTAQQALLGGSLYTTLDVYSGGSVDHVTCPTINFGYKNTEISDNTSFTNTSTEDPVSYSADNACGDLWCGLTDTRGQVLTGYEDIDESSGYWYSYSDINEYGNSSFTFPPEIEEDTYGNFFGPLIQAYGGIKASVMMGAGYDYPYAGLAFNIIGEDEKGADITAWGGLCLVYQSTTNFYIELAVENEGEVTEFNNYKITVPRSLNSITTEDFAWAKFKQESNWGKAVAQEHVLQKVSTIRLKFMGTAGSGGDFLIRSIGRLGKCN